MASTTAPDEAQGGRIAGRVINRESGAPVSGVAIVLDGTDYGTITGAEGEYTITGIPTGQYDVSFLRTGFIESSVTELEIVAGETEMLDFALPPRPAEMSDEVFELQNFRVTVEEANQMMQALDLRMDSVGLLNVMTNEDFSRFIAGDVGDAIKRIAGITVEGGRFAVIRGLDERYSSTTLNGAAVPSPDPERQSVPLDLFPSEIVSNIEVSKTFTPDLPGNSAGGSINIVTSTFPEDWEFSVSAKAGLNDMAEDRFLKRQTFGPRIIPFDDLDKAREISQNTTNAGLVAGDASAGREREFELKGGGSFEWKHRTFRVLASASSEIAYDTLQGFEENRFAQAQRSGTFIPGRPEFNIPTRFLGTGDLTKGELSGTTGRFDLTESERSERTTYLFATEVDVDTKGEHQIGFTYFRNENEKEIASVRENGDFPNIDPTITEGEFSARTVITADLLDELQTPLGWAGGQRVAGFLETRLFESIVLDQIRSLEVFQFSGNHRLTNFLDGLELSWTVSEAQADQVDNDVITAQAILDASTGRIFTGQAQGVDFLQPTFAWRNVTEDQAFRRVDATYEFDVSQNVVFTPSAGYFYQRASRGTDQFFQQLGITTFGNALQRPPVFTFEEAIRTGIPSPASPRGADRDKALAKAEGRLDVDGAYLSGKLTLFKSIDLFAGVRFENVLMTTATNVDNEADFFNSELLRNGPGNAPRNQAQINSQILGFNDSQPLPPDFEGRIDESVTLPSVGITYRPTDSLRFSLAYSETLVRPSFKEFTFITSQNPITLDFESGNPSLQTSDVQSFDFRVEYVRDQGDMLALSLFHKNVDNPIEKTTLSGTVESDVFFNNPNSATIEGVEFEFRKSLAFIGNDFFDYFSIGGNFALIDASVRIPETFRQLLSGGLAVTVGITPSVIGGGAYAELTGPGTFEGRFNEPPTERVLFQQPEWIANADVSFDNPSWGTRVTLSVFAQSKVLDKAGGFISRERATVDEFRKSYHEVNFSFSQRIYRYLSIGFGVKNLTNSERGVDFDESVGGTKRSYRVGRNYSIRLTGTF